MHFFASKSALAVCLGLLTIAPAYPQAYPSKPIRLIALGPAGSVSDLRARWVAEKLNAALGQPIVVDNRAGAGGNIGAEVAAKSPRDGYTLVVVHQGTLTLNPHLYARLGYDPIADFAPITRLVVSPLLLAVNPAVPAKSVAELVELARKTPGQLNYGSAGSGTPPHMAGELFRRMANIDVTHVPYKGGTPALMDLMGGRIAYTFDALVLQAPYAKSGKIRALGVTSTKRVAVLPEIPTVAESGVPGYEYWGWMEIAAPAGTPRSIVTRLNSELVKILRTAEARDWFAEQGGEPVGDTPEEFAAYIKAEHARWGSIIREARIKAD